MNKKNPATEIDNDNKPQSAAEAEWYRWAFGRNFLLGPDEFMRLLKECAIHHFRAGARYDFRTTAAMSPQIARFVEYMIWIDGGMNPDTVVGDMEITLAEPCHCDPPGSGEEHCTGNCL